MPYSPNLHNRRSIRLQSYDYAQSGAYFITINTNKKVHLFGEITASVLLLTEAGKIARDIWLEIPQHFNNVELGEFVIMPNHLHAIVVIRNGSDSQRGKGEAFGATVSDTIKVEQYSNLGKEPNFPTPNASPSRHPAGTTSGSVSAIVQNYKSVTTRKINKELVTPGASIWQRNYYEHIIRNEDDYARIVSYIRTNPERWEDGL